MRLTCFEPLFIFSHGDVSKVHNKQLDSNDASDHVHRREIHAVADLGAVVAPPNAKAYRDGVVKAFSPAYSVQN